VSKGMMISLVTLLWSFRQKSHIC